MKEFLTLDDFDLADKRVLLRVDINSPIDPATGDILDDSRLREHAVTIKDLRHTKLVLLAHQSRPGKKDFTTMEKHAQRLSQIVGHEVRYADGLFDRRTLETVDRMATGDIVLLENTRFYSEEVDTKDSDAAKMSKTHIVKRLSAAADYFVIDCFAAAHRAQPTIVGFAEVLPALAGRIMERELNMLGRALREDRRPKVGIFGGVKVDDSIDVIGALLGNGTLDRVITTGAVANIFLAAGGKDLGVPNVEFLKKELEGYDGLVEAARTLIKEKKGSIAVPSDLAVNDNGKRREITVDELPTRMPIHDIGLDTIINYCSEIGKSRTIILNGPSGVFESDEFSLGTAEVFKAVANARAFKVVGGGHTIAAVEKYGLASKIDHLSTGGGALISFLAGKKMPGVDALKRSKEKYESGGYKKK